MNFSIKNTVTSPIAIEVYDKLRTVVHDKFKIK